MKCHVCQGETMYLTNRIGDIRQHIQCPNCKGTHKEPFNAEAKCAELERRLKALEEMNDVKFVPPVNPGKRKMRDLIGFLDQIITRQEGKLNAREESKNALPERPPSAGFLFGERHTMSTTLTFREREAIAAYIEALEKALGR